MADRIVDNKLIINEQEYALEKKLVGKLDLMLDRCIRENPKNDALLINEGSEGEGKTNSSVVEAYWIKLRTNKEAHLFFRLGDLMRFAQSTEGKIIIWDEPSLDSLSTDSLNNVNKDLQRLMMTVRKKRHFFIFNFTKFYKFNEYVQVDRALGMIHMYSRKQIIPGRFLYIKKSNLEPLRNGYNNGKKRLYKQMSTFGGRFPDIMEKHFDSMGFYVNGIKNCSYNQYNLEKDKAINSIGGANKGMSKKEIATINKMKEVLAKVATIYQKEYLPKALLAKIMGVSGRTLAQWAENGLTEADFLAKPSFKGFDEQHNINTMVQEPEKPDATLEDDDIDDENNLNDDDFDSGVDKNVNSPAIIRQNKAGKPLIVLSE